MRKISFRQISNKKFAQVGGPETILLILNRIANGTHSARMLSALRGFITLEPDSVLSALRRVSDLEGLIANSSVIPELAPLLDSVRATSGAAAAAEAGAGAGAGAASGSGSALVSGGGAVAEATETAALTGAATETAAGAGALTGAGAVATEAGAGAGALTGAGAVATEAGAGAGALGLTGIAAGAALSIIGAASVGTDIYRAFQAMGLKLSSPDALVQGIYDELNRQFVSLWGWALGNTPGWIPHYGLDIKTTLNPFAGTSYSDDTSGEFSEITKQERDTIIRTLTNDALAGKSITVEYIAELFANTNKHVATKEEMLGNQDCRNIFAGVADYLTNVVQKSVIAAKKNSAPSVPAEVPHKNSGSSPTTSENATSERLDGTRGVNTHRSNYVQMMSEILMQKGFLAESQTTWNDTFDKAFRAFIDSATKVNKIRDPNAYQTSLSNGSESWQTVASNLRFSPDIRGAYNAVLSLSTLLSEKSNDTKAPDSAAAALENPENVLAEILSAMYSEKLVGTPGLDLVNEKRRCKIIVDAVGGPTDSGFKAAATVVLWEASQLGIDLRSRLPKTVGVPINKEFASRRSDLFKDIQVCINKVVAGAFGLLAPPADKAAVSGMKKWLAEKGFQITSSLNQQELVKLTSTRKERLLSKIAAEATVKELSEWRRVKARESVK